MPRFESHSLRKVYGASPAVAAVDDVSIAVERGARLVVTGPSGSGKTTLLALLSALERPTSGRVSFDKIELTSCSGAELARVRRRIGFVFQDFALIPNMTALENIGYPLIPRGIARPERRRRAEQLLGPFGLGSRAAVPVGYLSGGEQQRVAIIRALAGQPDAFVADEPTSNLDSETVGVFLQFLGEFQAAGGAAILASHDPRIAATATDLRTMTAGKLSAGNDVT